MRKSGRDEDGKGQFDGLSKVDQNSRTRRRFTQRIRPLLNMKPSLGEPIQTSRRLPTVYDVSFAEDDESIEESERVRSRSM